MVNFAPVNAGAAFWLRRLIINIATETERHDRGGGHGFKRRRRVVESRPTGRPPRSFPPVKTDSPAPLSVDCLNSFYDTNKNYANVLVLFIETEHNSGTF